MLPAPPVAERAGARRCHRDPAGRPSARRSLAVSLGLQGARETGADTQLSPPAVFQADLCVRRSHPAGNRACCPLRARHRAAWTTPSSAMRSSMQSCILSTCRGWPPTGRKPGAARPTTPVRRATTAASCACAGRRGPAGARVMRITARLGSVRAPGSPGSPGPGVRSVRPTSARGPASAGHRFDARASTQRPLRTSGVARAAAVRSGRVPSGSRTRPTGCRGCLAAPRTRTPATTAHSSGRG